MPWVLNIDMARVDFYILPDENRHTLQIFACKLAEKAWQQGHRILIKTDSRDESQLMDDLLWTFKDGSFVPHAVMGAAQDDQQPIVIGHDTTAQADYQLLINLSSSTPDHSAFERIAEILNQEPSRKQTGREHYKIYRDLGLDLHHHQM